MGEDGEIEEIPDLGANETRQLDFPNDYNDPLDEENVAILKALFKKYYLLEEPHPVFGEEQLDIFKEKPRENQEVRNEQETSEGLTNKAQEQVKGIPVPPPPPPRIN